MRRSREAIGPPPARHSTPRWTPAATSIPRRSTGADGRCGGSATPKGRSRAGNGPTPASGATASSPVPPGSRSGSRASTRPSGATSRRPAAGSPARSGSFATSHREPSRGGSSSRGRNGRATRGCRRISRPRQSRSPRRRATSISRSAGLAQLGLARVASGDVDAGLAHLDEAMTAASAGEPTSLETFADVCCALMLACDLAQRRRAPAAVGPGRGRVPAAVRARPAARLLQDVLRRHARRARAHRRGRGGADAVRSASSRQPASAHGARTRRRDSRRSAFSRGASRRPTSSCAVSTARRRRSRRRPRSASHAASPRPLRPCWSSGSTSSAATAS